MLNEWISVNDRLPVECTRVLVYMNLRPGAYTLCDTDRLVNGRWVRWGDYVTHWMPLPEPPKGE